MGVNNFYPFCPTDTGTNLLDVPSYSTDSDRNSGNQPGVARSKLVNRALRQANAIGSQVAQFITNRLGNDVVDDADMTKLQALMAATLTPLAPVFTNYLTGTGTHYITYVFFITSGNATVGATYTNNNQTFTVKQTITSGLILTATGTGTPALSGALTKATGTGDATINFYAFRMPVLLRVRMAGGGSGGSGSGSAGAGVGGSGGNTTFGTSLITASGATGQAGGGTTITAGAVGIGLTGGDAGNSTQVTNSTGGNGGTNALGGAGTGGSAGGIGVNAKAYTGAGGGGAGGFASGPSAAGGGAGGYVNAIITSPVASYAYAVGTGGTSGVAGTSGTAGGAGGGGMILIEENYQ